MKGTSQITRDRDTSKDVCPFCPSDCVPNVPALSLFCPLRVPYYRRNNMNEFTTENTREQIAHLLADAQKAIISTAHSLADVEIKIHAATALINQLIKHEAD